MDICLNIKDKEKIREEKALFLSENPDYTIKEQFNFNDGSIKVIFKQKNLFSEIEAIKKALIKKGIINNAEIEAEK